MTGAGELAAKYVIHAVGPIWRGGNHDERALLAGCYLRALELAAEHGCRTVALPAISTGAFAYPLEHAATVAIASVARAQQLHPEIEEARFWLFDTTTYRAFEVARGELIRTSRSG